MVGEPGRDALERIDAAVGARVAVRARDRTRQRVTAGGAVPRRRDVASEIAAALWRSTAVQAATCSYTDRGAAPTGNHGNGAAGVHGSSPGRRRTIRRPVIPGSSACLSASSPYTSMARSPLRACRWRDRREAETPVVTDVGRMEVSAHRARPHRAAPPRRPAASGCRRCRCPA